MSSESVAVDTNVLVYALYQESPEHDASRAFLDRGRAEEISLCFTSQVLAEFFSIVTNPKRVSIPRTPEEAVSAIVAFLAIPGAVILPVTSEAVSRWLIMVRNHPVRGGAVFDLQLIATIIANGVPRICTFNEQDFEGFQGLEIFPHES